MKINSTHIGTIRSYLIENGLSIKEVQDDVVDHICSIIENEFPPIANFENVFRNIQARFSPSDIKSIQENTLHYLTFKNEMIMIKAIFITGYLSACFILLGYFLGTYVYLDPQLRLAIAPMVSSIGSLILCFGFLPLLFVYGYKRVVGQLRQSAQ
jgi:hypothetical protein